MIALVNTGAYTMKQFFAISFGNDTVVFLLFIFVFTGMVDAVGLISFIANWFISRKCVIGRPWVFSALVLYGAFFAGGFVNMFAALVVFWGIIVLAYWVTIDGKPLMDFKKMANLGMSWEMFIIFAMVLPFAAIFSSEATGISAFIIETRYPVIG